MLERAEESRQQTTGRIAMIPARVTKRYDTSKSLNIGSFKWEISPADLRLLVKMMCLEIILYQKLGKLACLLRMENNSEHPT